jgi:hypothetical protein
MRRQIFTFSIFLSQNIQFSLCIGILLMCNSFSLAQPIQKLTTAGLEHTGTIRGMTKYALYEDDAIMSDGDNQLFSNGFSGAVHMGGIKPAGELRTAVVYYYDNSSYTDFHSGLISDHTGLVIAESENFYNRIWKVSDYQISELLILQENGSIMADDIPDDILMWPGKGNPMIDPALVESDVAPFFDADNDGIYNPLLGDYPVVSSKKGIFVPSQFTFTVYHDQGLHGVTNTLPMNMQFFQTQYVINCNEGDLDRTVFTIIKTKSHDTETFNNLYIGFYMDHDIGCQAREGFGYDAQTNSVFAYKKGGYDTTSCLYGNEPIDNSLSVSKSTIFDQALSSVINVRNYTPFEPSYPGIEEYNGLRGQFGDGTALTYGGSGFNPTSTDTVSYIFPDFPNDPNGWSLETVDVPDTDFRILPSISLGEIEPGEINQIEFAELVMVSSTEAGLEIFNSYRDRVFAMETAHLAYINDESLCPQVQICENDCIWPGDANNNGKVESDDYLYISAAQNLMNADRRQHIDIEWLPHSGENWGTNASTIDFKHSDVNGNGVINSGDLKSTEKNFGMQNVNYVQNENTVILDDPDGLHYTNIKDEYSAIGTFVGRLVRPKLFLGNDDSILENEIMGLSYKITWDTSIMRLSDLFIGIEEEIFDYSNYGYDLPDGATSTNIGDSGDASSLHNAHFNFMNGNLSLGGLISKRIWEIKENATTTNTDGRDTVNLMFSNIVALNADGEKLDVGLRKSYSIIVNDLKIVNPTSVINTEIVDELVIFPNPASGILNYECIGCGTIISIKLISVNGSTIMQRNKKNKSSINIDEYAAGLYLLIVETIDGVYTEKVFII